MAKTVLQRAQDNLRYALHTNEDKLMKPFESARDKYNEMLDGMKETFFNSIVNLLYNVDGFEVRLSEEEAKRYKPIFDYEAERDILVNRIAIEWLDFNNIINSKIRISGIDKWCFGERKKDGKQKHYNVITKESDGYILHELHQMLFSYLLRI